MNDEIERSIYIWFRSTKNNISEIVEATDNNITVDSSVQDLINYVSTELKKLE